MSNGKREGKLISPQMVLFEFRNTIGNPYVHIFGVGMPVLMMIIIIRAMSAQVTDAAMRADMSTSVFLGIGVLIPLATVFMGYGVSHAQELEKGIPQRMELFGIRTSVSLCNRILSEMIFMLLAFCIYFTVGCFFVDMKRPSLPGAALYILCIFVLSVILFCLSYAISSMLRKFSLTYCVTMILYFAMMILGGMMGISYDNLPSAVQAIAKLLPVTYINRDFYMVWKGEHYNFVPMLQSYLFLAALAGILLLLALRRMSRRLH